MGIDKQRHPADSDNAEIQSVLILCTGNSCRSQMAEVIWNELGRDHWQAFSAGSHPSGYVHPLAIDVMHELQVPTTGLTSKSIDAFKDRPFDLVITVCDNAKDSCPVIAGAQKTLHWPFIDPADADGTDEQKRTIFRRVRDQIKQKISDYLDGEDTHPANPDRPVFSPSAKSDCLKLIELALIEDIGDKNLVEGIDCTSEALVPASAIARAAFVSRDQGIVCGVEIARLAIEQCSPELSLEVGVCDGQEVSPSQTIAVIEGPAHAILTMERTCLNFMCRLSGISTLVQRFVNETQGTSACILDTRKTTPGWRRLEKYAVVCGGGKNHRMGLYDAIMIKDNHLAFFRTLVENDQDTIPTAVETARNWIAQNSSRIPHGNKTIVQLEVDTLEQFEIALTTRCDIVLLDNMDCQHLTNAVMMRNERAPQMLLEASGGVDLNTIGDIARTGVDRISVGALTHSAINFDIGLDWESRTLSVDH